MKIVRNTTEFQFLIFFLFKSFFLGNSCILQINWYIYVLPGYIVVVVVVVLLFYVHGKHLRSCRDGQLT